MTGIMSVQKLLGAGMLSWQVLGQLFRHEAEVFWNYRRDCTVVCA